MFEILRLIGFRYIPTQLPLSNQKSQELSSTAPMEWVQDFQALIYFKAVHAYMNSCNHWLDIGHQLQDLIPSSVNYNFCNTTVHPTRCHHGSSNAAVRGSKGPCKRLAGDAQKSRGPKKIVLPTRLGNKKSPILHPAETLGNALTVDLTVLYLQVNTHSFTRFGSFVKCF